MTEQLSSGLELMLIGMGIVFLFLVMLIGVVNLMSTLVQRFLPETATGKEQVSRQEHATDKAIVAAISTAVHQYRNRHKY